MGRGFKFARMNIDSIDDFSFIWAEVSCPVVNHPSQIHLLPSKVHNMRLAALKIDGLLIQPGDFFSFWRLVGRPSVKNGFRSGPTFSDGRIIESVGGGLCQISGLMYNLALESGMSILERYPHTIDSYGERRYLPLARDATVAWMSKDLLFQNRTGYPVRVEVRVDQSQASGRILSTLDKPFIVFLDRYDASEEKDVLFRKAGLKRKVDYGNGRILEEDFGWDIYSIPD